MGTFFRSRFGLDNEQGFVQGAARILLAPIGTPWPDGIEDLVDLSATATAYDAVGPWFDAGFTKTGVNIVRNNAEDTFDVDQVSSDIKRRPSNWEMNVGTQLAEGTLETFQLVWELGPITTVTKVTPQLNERHIGMGAPTTYTERMLAVLFQFPDATIRAWIWRNVTRAPQESGFTLNKTGEQVSLPQRWNALADPDAPVGSEFGVIMEQVPA